MKVITYAFFDCDEKEAEQKGKQWNAKALAKVEAAGLDLCGTENKRLQLFDNLIKIEGRTKATSMVLVVGDVVRRRLDEEFDFEVEKPELTLCLISSFDLEHPLVGTVADWLLSLGAIVTDLDSDLSLFEEPKEHRPHYVKIARALQARQDRGLRAAGPAPFGYRWGITKTGAKNLVVNDSEAQHVRWMFALYARLKSLSKVEREVKKEQIKNRNGRYFTRAGIGGILKNKTYLGYLGHGGKVTQGAHPAIIGRTQFDYVNQLRQKRNRRLCAAS